MANSRIDMIRTAVLLLAFAGSVLAETQSGVVQSGGQAIPGASVTAVCGTDKITTITDDAGRFELGGLPATPCKFFVSMFGFEPAQRDVTASSSSLSFNLNLQTHATLATEPSATSANAEQTPAQTPQGPGRRGFGRGGAGRGGFAGGPGRGGFPGGGAPGAGSPDANQGQQAGTQQNAAGNGRGGGRGFQNLSLIQNGDNALAADDVIPSLNGATEDAGGATEAFLVNGSLSQGVQAQAGDNVGLGGFGDFGRGGPGGNPFANTNGNALQDNGTPALNAGDLGGGPGGGGGGGGRGGGGGFGGGGHGGGGFGGGRGGRGGRGPNRNLQFGNRINRGRGRQFQGSVYYTVGNSVLNARPYSFTSPTTLAGTELPKAGYAANRFGFSAGGPLTIPHVFSSDKTFWFVNYTGNRSKNGFDQVTTVPTLAERQGNFSALSTVVNNPFTTTPFAGNLVPSSLFSQASVGLLNFIPLPNAPGLRNNYQLIGANPTNSDNLQTRINQTITDKDALDVNFNFQHRNSETIQQFGFADPTSGYGLSTSLTYRRTFSRTLINSVVWNFSRNVNRTLSPFSFGADIAGNLGITGVSTDPAAYGPPTINFANFGTLSDATPTLTRPQTSGVNDTVNFIRGKQTIQFGLGFQRRQNNTQIQSNARGNFSFTGLATGYDFADFLLGLPQSTSVARYTDNSYYLRETAVNAFVQDDYRILSNLTINGGLRWEYFGPYTEKNGALSNLAIAPGSTGVTVVLPGNAGYPQGLINPDYKLISPRIGIAWKPWKSKQIVARAGYGIYFNGSVYGQLASRMIGQPPFAETSTQQTTAEAPLTLQNGFPPVASEAIANTFSVDKNYHPGYAQTWTTSIQESFGRSYVFEVIYNGTKGTDLDVLQLPNRALPGNPLTAQQRLLIPYASEFVFDDSIGNSIYHAGQVRFTRRFARSSSFNIFYTYSKSIDDTSTLGGGAVLIPNDLSAERALSPTDQRHNLRINYQFQSPINNTRSGFVADLLRGWTIGGTLTASSGTPFTAVVPGDPSGTGYTGNSRAQATGLPITDGSGFFNPLAFTVPATGTFGNAGRDTIPGIARYTLTASFFRSFRIDDRRRIEFRIDSTNPMNHPYITQINTTVGSLQYGLPLTAGAMRSVTATVRLRF
ncbi:MAG TPA: TonB-dependent receptor [Bryobacteraceae bacterium]|nr:TonB-dependent receptor [Bryobacteraceae bacterium]